MTLASLGMPQWHPLLEAPICAFPLLKPWSLMKLGTLSALSQIQIMKLRINTNGNLTLMVSSLYHHYGGTQDTLSQGVLAQELSWPHS